MHERTAQLRRGWSRTRAVVLASLVLGLVLAATAWDGIDAVEALSWLTAPGAVWTLWIASELAADQKDDATELWRWQSARAPVVLATASVAGAATPALMLLAIGTVATALDGNAHLAVLTALWTAAAAMAFTAIGRWRRNIEPRTAHGWRARLFVIATVGAIAGFTHAVVPDTALSGWLTDAHLRWGYAGAIICLVCAVWAGARAELAPRGAPVCYAVWLNAWGLWATQFPADPAIERTGAVLGAAFVALGAGVTALIAPRGAHAVHTDPLYAATLSVIAWTTMSALYLAFGNTTIDDMAPGAMLVWGIFVVRDLIVYDVLRRTAPTERTPGLLWCAYLLVMNAALPMAIAASRLAESAITHLAVLPIHRMIDAQTAPLGATSVVLAAAGCTATWLMWRRIEHATRAHAPCITLAETDPAQRRRAQSAVQSARD